MIHQNEHGVEVVDNHFQTGLLFYKYENGTLYIAKPVDLEYVKVKDEFQSITPTLTLPMKISRELPTKLSEALGRNGIMAQTEAQNKGELEAIKRHLEDVQNINYACLTKMGFKFNDK